MINASYVARAAAKCGTRRDRHATRIEIHRTPDKRTIFARTIGFTDMKSSVAAALIRASYVPLRTDSLRLSA